MKKVGIITLNGYHNYGNRLQNYALQSVLSKLEVESETILNETYEKQVIKENKIKKFINMNLEEKKNLLWLKKEEAWKKINKKNLNKMQYEREIIFRDFTKKYIRETNFSINKTKIPKKINQKYDYFITGSDQVWNPNDPTVSEINFLNFVDKKKRIAYAPSFGVNYLEENIGYKYKELIKEIENLSVRENEGAELIEDLIGIKPIVLVDPTMLISKEEWLDIARKDRNKPLKKYLLTYFLGGIPKEHKKYVENIAQKENLEIVDLANIKIKKYYTNGPSEFIDYINSAELFITDSFHGCVFSMILEKPFIVCKRAKHSKKNEMYSRIDTFLSKFKLDTRKFENVKNNELFKINYTESYKILNKEKEKSYNFLNKALGIKQKIE